MIQESYFTNVHTYNYSKIPSQFQSLSKLTNKLISGTDNSSTHVNNLAILLELQSEINNKISLLDFHSRRNKRSLLPILGKGIKFITGNLDSDDAEKFNQIIANIRTDQNRLQRQSELQYSFSKITSEKYDKLTQQLIVNEEALANKINQLILSNNDNHNTVIEIQLGQLILLHEHMFRALEKLETMIAYCSAGKYHPSILSYQELSHTYSVIQTTYPSNFQYSPTNMIDMEKTIKTSCTSIDHAIYFLVSIPLFTEESFEYYYLLPIPFKRNNQILSMIPEHKIILKGTNRTYSTNKDCMIGDRYQCYQNDLEVGSSCENQILSLHLEHCIFTELNITNHVEFVPMLNAYLLSLFNPTVLHIQGKEGEILDYLSGILLLNATDVTLKIFNKTFRNSISSYGKMLMIPSPNNFTILPNQILPIVLDTGFSTFQNLDLNKLIPSTLNHRLFLDEENSFWKKIVYIFIIFIVICIGIHFVLRCVKTIQKDKTTIEKLIPQSVPSQEPSVPEPSVPTYYFKFDPTPEQLAANRPKTYPLGPYYPPVRD